MGFSMPKMAKKVKVGLKDTVFIDVAPPYEQKAHIIPEVSRFLSFN